MQTGRTTPPFFARLQARETPPSWNLGSAFFYVVAYAIVWMMCVLIVSVLLGDTGGSIAPATYIYSALLSNVVMVIGVYQWARRRLGNQWITNLRLDPVGNQQAILTLLISLGVAWSIDLIGVLLQAKGGQVVPPQFNALLQAIDLTWVVGAVVALLLQPVAETLVFSGLLYPATTKRGADNARSALAVGIVYMFVHVLLAVQQSPWYVVAYPLLTGLYVTGVRAYTKSTRLAIIARVGIGLFIVLAALIGRSFGA